MAARPPDITGFLANLGAIIRMINSGRDPQDILNRIAYALCHQTPWSSSSIMAIDRAHNAAVQVASYYPMEQRLPESWPLGRSPTSIVIASGRPFVIADAKHDREYIGYWTAAQVRHFRTVVLLPMHVTDEAGRPMILSLHAADKLSIAEDDLALLASIADLAGIAVEKGQRLKAERSANEQLGRLLALHRNLIDRALGESSLESVVNVGRQFLEVPFIVADLTTGRAVAAGVPPGMPPAVKLSEAAFNAFLQAKGWPGIVAVFRDQGAARFTEGTLRRLALHPQAKAAAAIVEPVSIGGRVVGGLIAFPPHGQADPALLSTAGSIWMYLSVILLRHHIIFESEFDIHSETITRLVEGSIRDDAAFLARAAERGLALGKPHRLLTVSLADRATSASTRWALSKLARAAKPNRVFAMVDDTYVFLVPAEEKAEPLAQLIDEELRRVSGQRPIIAEGQACAHLSDYPASWHRLRRLLGWAREAGLEGVIKSVDAGPMALLADAVDHRLARDLADQVLKPIADHDRSRAVPLRPTLEALLRSGGRLQAAAAELGVHITTVRYRAGRLRELFGLDLDDPETRFKLELALRLQKLVPGSLPDAPSVIPLARDLPKPRKLRPTRRASRTR